jgi:hypothetical protein
MKIREICCIILTALILIYCSSSQDATKQAGDQDSSEVYVFDTVADSASNTGEAEEIPADFESGVADTDLVDLFLVQVGAYSTEERAKKFIEQNMSKIDHELTIHYSEKVNLYVIQLPPFRTRIKAEEVRDQLWRIPEFKDSFIVPK